MIIAIAASESNLKSNIDPHFGRCNFYCLYDTETKRSSFVENPARYYKEQAGSEAALFLIEKRIKIVIAGRFGSKAVDVFKSNEVQMIVPQTQQTIYELINSIR